jgi:hypothetical protein
MKTYLNILFFLIAAFLWSTTNNFGLCCNDASNSQIEGMAVGDDFEDTDDAIVTTRKFIFTPISCNTNKRYTFVVIIGILAVEVKPPRLFS